MVPRSLVSVAILVLVHLAVVPSRGVADPDPARVLGTHETIRPGAAALGAGTIFLTRQPLRVPEGGVLFLTQGRVRPSLEQPVGSCRLRLRVPGSELPAGTPLTVASVDATVSPYEERGISSVTWHFEPGDPAETLMCDTVGSNGPSQGEVESEVAGVLKIEPVRRLQ